jgi:hypothetical protein
VGWNSNEFFFLNYLILIAYAAFGQLFQLLLWSIKPKLIHARFQVLGLLGLRLSGKNPVLKSSVALTVPTSPY